MGSHVTWEGFVDSLFTKIQQPTSLAIIATILVVVLTTRALSGDSPSSRNGLQTPSTPPYWVPFFGHAPQMAINPNGFLASLRQRHPEGVFSLKTMGKAHSFIYRPSFASALLSKPNSVADGQGASKKLSPANFGLSSKDQLTYDDVFHDADAHFKNLISGPGLESLTDATIGQIKEYIADWVTFNAYPSDQMEWERLAGADTVENEKGEMVMEADLMELTRNFIAKTASAALFGTDFVENFPETWASMWLLEKGFHLLQSNMPAWMPLPQVQRVRSVRRRILSCTYEFEVAMDKFLDGEDPGIKWQDLHNVSDLVKDRVAQFRKHKLSMDARASCDLSLAWAINTNSNPLVAWMLFELSRDVILAEQVREEIAPFVRATQPKNDFPTAVWIAPQMETLDLDGLLTKCPLLKAAYIETLRMYTGADTTRLIREDVVLQEDGSDEKYLLKKGTYAHVPQELHLMDPEYFPDPREWQIERHIKEAVDQSGRKTRVVDMGTMKPFGKLATCLCLDISN